MFIPYGTFIVILVYWFWNPVATWWQRGTKCFFDKHCIHQSHQETQRAGLYRMPLYLKNSKMICCIFDSVYITRMWCIFELAIYLRLRKKPRVLFINTSQKLLEIVYVSWKLGTFSLMSIARRSVINANVPTELFLWYRLCDGLLRMTLLFLLAQRYFRDLLTLRDIVSNYDVRKSELGQPNDRPMLLQFINFYWGGDQDRRRGDSDEQDDENAEDPSAVADGAANDDARQEEVTGLDKCNRDIRERVLRYLPMRGPKSWMILSYVAAVLCSAPQAIVDYERWGYHAIWNDEGQLADTIRGDNAPLYSYKLKSRNVDVSTQTLDIYFSDLGQGITSILSLCSKVFLLGPMSMLILGAEIRFFLWMQQLTKLPYWWSVLIFLPIFLFIEVILDTRFNLFFNLMNATSLAVGSLNINVARIIFQTRTRDPGTNSYHSLIDPLAFPSHVDDSSVSFLGIRQFNVDVTGSAEKDMWYPFIWRPFWGIYYIFQYYFGYCQITNLWRSSDWQGKISHVSTNHCRDKQRAKELTAMLKKKLANKIFGYLH